MFHSGVFFGGLGWLLIGGFMYALIRVRAAQRDGQFVSKHELYVARLGVALVLQGIAFVVFALLGRERIDVGLGLLLMEIGIVTVVLYFLTTPYKVGKLQVPETLFTPEQLLAKNEVIAQFKRVAAIFGAVCFLVGATLFAIGMLT